MSFKREGNDSAMLKNFQKARVSDLLLSGIPEDNAKFLNDGRLTCLVCFGNHIFDNVNILKTHRMTEKHKRMQEKFELRKRSKFLTIKKRIEMSKVKGEDTAILERKKRELLRMSRSSLIGKTNPLPLNLRPKSKIDLSESAAKKCEETMQFKLLNKNNKDCLGVKKPSVTTQISCLEAVSNVVKAPALEKTLALTTEQRRKQKETNLQMLSEGWIKDRNGEWIKDANVEFDTDSDSS